MAGSSLTKKLDAFLDSLYRNHELPRSPRGARGQVWAMPSMPISFSWSETADGKIKPGEAYFLHYYQNQRFGTQTDNECVTTSALMSMNILKDWIAASQGQPLEPDESVAEFTGRLDKGGVSAWRFRFPSKSFLPGFMTPWQAVLALKQHAAKLKKNYGKSFTAKLSAWNTLENLIEGLKAGKLIILHGAWKMSIDPEKPGYNPLLGWLGGMPHTVVLVGYEGENDTWYLLNPAEPWPKDHNTPVEPKLQKMTSQELMAYWGRQFLFYPPRFAMTAITLDS